MLRVQLVIFQAALGVEEMAAYQATAWR
jgi:hypothetical protein